MLLGQQEMSGEAGTKGANLYRDAGRMPRRCRHPERGVSLS